MLMVLGGSLTLLNLPLELLTLAYDCPWMTVISDIKQGVFYSSLLSFWLIFAGEHLMVGYSILGFVLSKYKFKIVTLREGNLPPRIVTVSHPD